MEFYSVLTAKLNFRFFSARKHGLVDAAVRSSAADRTAVIALPGGIGTLDELFEIMALIQLERIGSTLPVPFLLLNYDSYYSKLLEYLAEFYNVPAAKRNYQISPPLKQHRTSYATS
jgi:predicted Rossmann-fold nucleotide-binding protein